MFGIKSQKSPTAGAFSFQALHTTFLILRDDIRAKLIISDRSIIAYLPVGFIKQQQESKNEEKHKQKICRLDSIDVLHDSLKKAFNSMREVAVCGEKCKTHVEVGLKCHLVLICYVADLPKTEGLLSLKREIQTSFACHRCMAPRKYLSGTTKAKSRSFEMSRKLISLCLPID